MKIVVLDGMTLEPGDNPWDELADLGELVVYDRTPPEEIVERARDAEILLTNKTRLPTEILAQLPALRFVVVLATGYDVVDVAAARERMVPVSNVPEYGTEAVAQHSFALLLELTNGVGEHDQAVHSGEWCRSPDFSFWHRAPRALSGLTFGVVGYGRIGRRVAAIAESFGMRVIVTTRKQSDSNVDIDELFSRADVVSLHCPTTPETSGMVNAKRLAQMRPGALLINTARGALIDEAALAQALKVGPIGGAAVDVLSSEPPLPKNPLLSAPRCIVTPHMAWGSVDARRRLMEISINNVRSYIQGSPENQVNP